MDDDSVSEAEEYEIFESETKLEPRYLDSWQQKNWLQTGDSQP